MKKGILAEKPEWWKHLRPFNKRLFWHQHRHAEQDEIAQEETELLAWRRSLSDPEFDDQD